MRWKIFNPPYRWIPSTILRNLYSCFLDIYYGIWNVIRWTPVIWCDFDYDWYFLANIMRYKLRRMSKVFGEALPKEARQTLICAELIDRLIEDDFLEPLTKANIERDDERKRYWSEMLGDQIGKNLRRWWI